MHTIIELVEFIFYEAIFFELVFFANISLLFIDFY
jgi:hypothetical protein